MEQSKQAFPLSIWIVDNSGSMIHVDGHRIIQKQNQLKLVECTRWAEMQQTIEYHAMMAAQLQSPTVFRYDLPFLSLSRRERGWDVLCVCGWCGRIAD